MKQTEQKQTEETKELIDKLNSAIVLQDRVTLRFKEKKDNDMVSYSVGFKLGLKSVLDYAQKKYKYIL